jgi:cell division protein FtsQ
VVTTVALAAKRRAQQRRRRYRRLAVWAAVLAPPALLGAAAYSPLLDVNAVRVSGTHRITTARIVAAAKVAHGVPLVSVDVGAVRRRVAALPGVKSVVVTRAWPSALSVRVVERVPVVAVPRGSVTDLYDVDAVLVDTVLVAPPATPRLAVASGSPTPAVIDAAVALLRALPASLRKDVRDLRADGASSLSFDFADGAQVVWGSGERTAEKVRTLTMLVPQHAKRYDVRVPDRPAVVP